MLYTENFEVAANNGLSVVYFHNGGGHHENLGRALARFPDITFITHGDFVRSHIDDLLDRYPNVYFTFNDIFDEHIPLFRFGDVFFAEPERQHPKTDAQRNKIVADQEVGSIVQDRKSVV